MIAIDSMIWIYNCDTNSNEHRNVRRWLRGYEKRKGILQSEQILLNTVITMEVLHNLRRVARLPANLVYDYVSKMISMNNIFTESLDIALVQESMQVLEDYYEYGIGGRDATILASMRRNGVKRLATHDRNLLSVLDIERVDPTVDPPIVTSIGETIR
jgi:predicted nucleic acid-binding protein